MGYILVEFDGKDILVSHKQCWYLRGESMTRLIKDAFNLLTADQLKTISPFKQIFYAEDGGDGEYTICSDIYTDRILPCYIFDHWKEAKIDDYTDTCEKIIEKSKEPFKFNKIFWSGQISHQTRKIFVDKFLNHPKFDIIIQNDHWGHNKEYPKKYLSLPDHCDYKYLIDLQGNGYSGRLKFLLYTNRTLFFQERRYHEYYFWDLVPYEHYIPIKENLSDLEEKIDWAENHQDQCAEIAKNAYNFAISNLKREDALNRLKNILLNIGSKQKEKNTPVYKTEIQNMNNQKYDLVLCVLACAKKEKYIKRLKEFIQTYGFKWINKNNNIKIVFLVDDEPKPNFINGPEYEWYNCTNLPTSLRFLSYIKHQDINTRWIMQVDDDSSTDLDKVIELLDQFYDNKDSMILMGGRNTDLEQAQQTILRIMKIPNVFFNNNDISKFDTIPYFTHAWEPSIISESAISKIKNYERLTEFYDLCIKYTPIFGDQTPYVAAKLSKVPVVECLFMSPFAKDEEYSAINRYGRFAHIHYITESWPNYRDFISKMKTIKELDSNNKYDNIIYNDNLWEFWAYNKKTMTQRFLGVMQLKSDGTIGLYNHYNENSWKKDNNNIIFYNQNKEQSSILMSINEDEYSGSYLFDKDVIHKIKKI